MNRHATDIIKHLERVTATGRSQSNIFDDWLELVQASLEALPAHLRSAHQGQPLTDTPETQALLARLRNWYPQSWCWQEFTAAFGILLDSATEWQDTLGTAYMDFGIPNKYTGQFFTPYDLAEAMAEMTMIGVEQQVHERIKAAIAKDPLAQAMTLAGATCQTAQEAEAWFFGHVLPAALPHVEPVTVCDCCCGSGVMLLAAASRCPRWALDYGLVQFYGQDIDLTCVRMARVNLMVYGLNSFNLKCALELTPAELQALPEPFAGAYSEAQTAQAAGDVQQVEQIAVDLRAGRYVQAGLFEISVSEGG